MPKNLPDIKSRNQVKWHKNTMTKELMRGARYDVGFANEIRLERLFELIDWYVETVGAPEEIYKKWDDGK